MSHVVTGLYGVFAAMLRGDREAMEEAMADDDGQKTEEELRAEPREDRQRRLTEAANTMLGVPPAKENDGDSDDD